MQKEVDRLHSIVCELRTSKSENEHFKLLAFLRKAKGFLGQDNLSVCKRKQPTTLSSSVQTHLVFKQ